MARRLLNWRIMVALFFCASVALAPAIAEARAGGSSGGRSSSMGSRGLRTYENNSAQPLGRSMSPLTQTPAQPGLSPGASSSAYGSGSFFQRHPFLTGLAGGFIGSWLFGHSGYAADGTSGGSAMGMLLEVLIIGAVDIFRGAAVPRARVLEWMARRDAILDAAIGGSVGRTDAAESRARHKSVRCRP